MRENRDYDYNQTIENEILCEYENLFSKDKCTKYKIYSNDTIPITVEKILKKLEIN